MGRLFQIYETDLAELEHALPQLVDALYPALAGDAGNRLRVQIRRVKEIVANVRWNYGPPAEVIIIPADGESSPPESGGSEPSSSP